ncbi:MAG: isopentenyl-diphosphate Delta-isomerase [Dactylosporangium sp.]|nr:isopentenyl-diphosphate Delta-isomerase [Dactylosporangium sp.]NNJ61855.1 isopentenyl-diphosphate Delta-isomerase [Dactylosporangium sp.]
MDRTSGLPPASRIDAVIGSVTQPTNREHALVVTVDEGGASLGTCTVAEAHAGSGVRHRAFSVLLRDPRGRVLLQRRASVKTRFPGAWANTCCGHPAPEEDLAVSAARRLTEEMGLRGIRLVEAGSFAYQATDPATGRVEHEFDHVLVGRTDTDPIPDPAEVADWCWLAPSSLPDLPPRLAGASARYAPWLAPVLRLACAHWEASGRG